MTIAKDTFNSLSKMDLALNTVINRPTILNSLLNMSGLKKAATLGQNNVDEAFDMINSAFPQLETSVELAFPPSVVVTRPMGIVLKFMKVLKELSQAAKGIRECVTVPLLAKPALTNQLMQWMTQPRFAPETRPPAQNRPSLRIL
jgi:hypothetical protein